jgi:hypothetical protein
MKGTPNFFKGPCPKWWEWLIFVAAVVAAQSLVLWFKNG